MRVVLDTNVIIAAFAARGLCAEIFGVCLEGHDIVLSEAILRESQEKLSAKVGLPKAVVRDIIAYLRDTSEIVRPEPVEAEACRDKDDLLIIGTALSGKAEVIITGDEDLLSLKKYRDVEIINPREFWRRLKG
jgi:putative PIN family toxin of toxin-antitoxin system